MTALLKADAVTVWRGDNVLLDEISFILNGGQVLLVHGANGSGKTTLLRVVCGLGYADEGTVYWRGESMPKATPRFNQELLYLGHRSGIKGGLTPIENLALFTAVRPNASAFGSTQLSAAELADVSPLIKHALGELGLQSVLDIPCRYLSAGQQRRVSLARLILQSAVLWILDEPLTSLDKNGLDWVRKQIEKHVAGGGAVLLTTHAALEFDTVQVNTLALA